MCYHSGSEWTWDQWHWKGNLHPPNLQDWSLTIRWFNVIYRTHIEEVLPLCQDAVSVFYSLSWLGLNKLKIKGKVTRAVFASASHQTGLDTKSMTRRSDYNGDWERERSGMSWGSSPAWLCWSLAHLVQYGPDELSRI